MGAPTAAGCVTVGEALAVPVARVVTGLVAATGVVAAVATGFVAVAADLDGVKLATVSSAGVTVGSAKLGRVTGSAVEDTELPVVGLPAVEDTELRVVPGVEDTVTSCSSVATAASFSLLTDLTDSRAPVERRTLLLQRMPASGSFRVPALSV